MKYLSEITLPNDTAVALNAVTKRYVDSRGGGPADYSRWFGDGVSNSTTITTSVIGVGDLAFDSVVGTAAATGATADYTDILFTSAPNTSYVRWNTTEPTDLQVSFDIVCPTDPAATVNILQFTDIGGSGKLMSLGIVGTGGNVRKIRVYDSADANIVTTTGQLTASQRYTLKVKWHTGGSNNPVTVSIYNSAGVLFESISGNVTNSGTNLPYSIRFGISYTATSSQTIQAGKFAYEEYSTHDEITFLTGQQYLPIEGGQLTGNLYITSNDVYGALYLGDIGFLNSSLQYDPDDGLTINADGQIFLASSTEEIDAGTSLIHNVVDPVDDQDAATKAYVDANGGGAPEVYVGGAYPTLTADGIWADIAAPVSGGSIVIEDYMLTTGATMTGLLSLAASATGNAGLRLPHGVAPTSPVNGDIWTTTAGIYVRVNGVTSGPLVEKSYVDTRTPQITVATSAPSSPATNDLWIDST